jgi:hypothetical protein
MYFSASDTEFPLALQPASPPSRARLSLQCSACHRQVAEKRSKTGFKHNTQAVSKRAVVSGGRSESSDSVDRRGVCERRRKWCGQAVSCRRLFGVVLGSVHLVHRAVCVCVAKFTEQKMVQFWPILKGNPRPFDRNRRSRNVRVGSVRLQGLKLSHAVSTCYWRLVIKFAAMGAVAPSAIIPEYSATRFNLRRHTRGPSTALPLACHARPVPLSPAS